MSPTPSGAHPSGEIEPSLADFRLLAPDRRVISVHRRLLLDTETATGLYRKLAGNRPGTFLLESAEQGVWSRYSFIGVNAVATLSEADGEATWTGRVPAGMPSGGDPLTAVAETLRRLHTPRDPRCRRSRRDWSATSGTTSCVGSNDCRTAIPTTCRSPSWCCWWWATWWSWTTTTTRSG